MTLFIHFKIHLGRRKLSKDNGLQQEEEFNDLMHGTGTETPNSVKVVCLIKLHALLSRKNGSDNWGSGIW